MNGTWNSECIGSSPVRAPSIAEGEKEREHGKAHAECTSKGQDIYLERRRRRRSKAHSNVLSGGALKQIGHLRLEHARVVSFEARVAFLARACARVLFVQKVALGEREL